jgi:hypothetical protein
VLHCPSRFSGATLVVDPSKEMVYPRSLPTLPVQP